MTTLAAVALISCGKEQQQQPELPAVGFPEDGVVRISASAGNPQTRGDGTETQEYAGTTLGLFLDYGSGERFTMNNVRWTKASDWKADEQMLWKDSKTAAKLYAYAPYVDGQNDPAKIEFSVPADQSAGTTEADADLVTWADDAFIPDNNKSANFTIDGKVLITFTHRLVKLTFNFEKGNQYGDDVTVKEAVLLGTTSKVLCDATGVNDPVVTATSDAASLNITLRKLGDFRYEAVFFPGNGQKAGAKMLKVTMSDGSVLYYTVPNDGLVTGGLKSGSAYEMKMRLGKDKIEIAKDGITVGGWNEVSTPLPGGETQVNADVWDGTSAPFKENDGAGKVLGKSESTPILIESAAQLAYLAQQVKDGNPYEGKYFKLTKDLVLGEIPWTPIGSFPKKFSGHFDGGNKEVYGLNVDITTSYAGLFGYIYNGSVKNVRICSGSVKASKYYVGGIVGDLDDSNMESCTASVNVSGNANVGGLVGSISGSTVSNCHFLSGEIDGEENVGGIVGNAQSSTSTVSDCSANASVKGNTCVGGLCGWFGKHDHVFSKCTMKGSVTVTGNSCGGLVGNIYSSKGKFETCQFEGSIKKDGSYFYKTGIAIGADNSNVTFLGCGCIIDAQTNTGLNGKKVGYINNKSADNENVRADNYDYSDITVTVKGDDTQN